MTTTTNLWQALDDAFGESEYLHSPGTGNHQALGLVIEAAQGLDTDEEQIAYIAGAIAAMALCDLGMAMQVAHGIFDGDYAANPDTEQGDDDLIAIPGLV